MSAWHIVTGEYPPDCGGVADYTGQVATALAAAGDPVHVWCPGDAKAPASEAGVIVHRTCGRFAPGDLRRLGAALDALPGPRQLLVQYVPHAFFYRSLNVALCAWVWSRAKRRGDRAHLMVHEAFLAFDGSAAQHAAALVHRAMAVLLLDAASMVWIAIPHWEQMLRPFALRGIQRFRWLPVPSNVAVAQASLRPVTEGRVVGHFGTYGRLITSCLTPVWEELAQRGGCRFVAIGRGSEAYRVSLPAAWRQLVTATGDISAGALSQQLHACDVVVQPYPDGVSTRRTTAITALAHGIPLVSNRGPHTEQQVWEGVALLTGTGDVAAMADAVQLLLADRARREKMAHAQQQLYVERFALRHTIRALRSHALLGDAEEVVAAACESSS